MLLLLLLLLRWRNSLEALALGQLAGYYAALAADEDQLQVLIAVRGHGQVAFPVFYQSHILVCQLGGQLMMLFASYHRQIFLRRQQSAFLLQDMQVQSGLDAQNAVQGIV